MKLIRLIASPILMYVLAGVYALVLAIAIIKVFVRSGPCARILLLCSVVYFVATLAGCQSVGHVSSGRLFQKNQ